MTDLEKFIELYNSVGETLKKRESSIEKYFKELDKFKMDSICGGNKKLYEQFKESIGIK